ncbi:MAG: transposase [Thaumarchaeota archaeon]|nr:transposase [Nitrososphaerota archaeon]
MKFNPHVHAIITEGGFTDNDQWVSYPYFPFEPLRKTWQYQVLTRFKEVIPDTKENKALIDSLFKDHGNGFYVHAPEKSRINDKKQMMKYIGRYIRHPAIAENRIESYDGTEIRFFYEDHEKLIHHVSLAVEEFIGALIGHIPDKQFKTVRYYGVYYRVRSRHFKELRGMICITQKFLTKYLMDWAPNCEICGTKMNLVDTWIRKPPDVVNFGSKISDWVYITSA